MDKPIKDYTLAEAQEECKRFWDCYPECAFYDKAASESEIPCIIKLASPSRWNLNSCRWTLNDKALAAAIKVIWPNAEAIHRGPAHIAVLGNEFECLCYLARDHAPLLHPGETVKLDEIISGGTCDGSV